MILNWIAFTAVIPIILSQSSFKGNRTHFPNYKIRPEASSADPQFEINGRGIVNILNPYSRSVAPNTKSLQQQRSLWATQNNIRILYRTYNEAETYDDYIDQVNIACNFSETTSFDVIWVNSTITGALSKCLLDLYAWDFDIAAGHDPVFLSNSVIEDRLVSIPSESSLGVLLKNEDLMTKFGFSNPKTLDELESICEQILRGERNLDNWKVSCITGPFADQDELMSMTIEWIAAANGTIVQNKNVTIASSATADILSRIISWTGSGIIDASDIQEGTLKSSYERFRKGNSVFMFAQLPQINQLQQDPPTFSWGISPFPGVDNQFVGTMGGWSLGVYKYSKNPAAAVKTIKWMTSKEAQKSAILLSDPIKLLPTRSDLYYDGETCNSLGNGYCSEFSKVTPIVPPSAIVQNKYYNMTYYISSAIRSILLGDLDISSGLENLYLTLSSSLNLNGTFTKIGPVPTRPVKKGFSHLTLQVWILLLTCTCVVIPAIGFRLWYAYRIRKQKSEEAASATDSVGKQASLPAIQMNPIGGSYKFTKLTNEEDE